MSLRLVTLLALVCGADIVSEGTPTDLPISATGGMTTTPLTPGDVMEMNTDSGMVWLPTPYTDPDAPPDAGAPPTSRPDAGPPGACAPIEARLAHRREWLFSVAVKAEQLGWEVAAKAYCEQHPGEVECGRPNTASERDISEVTISGPEDAQPEIDPWLIRWGKDLARCRAAQPQPKKTR